MPVTVSGPVAAGTEVAKLLGLRVCCGALPPTQRMDIFRNANRNLGMPTKKSVQVCKDAKQDLIWNANVDYSFA